MYKHDFHRQEVLGEVVVEDFDDEEDHQDEEVQVTKKSPNSGIFYFMRDRGIRRF